MTAVKITLDTSKSPCDNGDNETADRWLPPQEPEMTRMANQPTEFRFGCELEQDSDGDWVLVPPVDVTIFSMPGEGYLIGRCDRETAASDAHTYLSTFPEAA